MHRRDFLISGLASLGLPSLGYLPLEPVDTNAPSNDQTNVTLRIAPISLEIGPGKTIKTVGYNGSAPGPILRFREGKQGINCSVAAGPGGPAARIGVQIERKETLHDTASLIDANELIHGTDYPR